ncbi:MAG: caspase family protein [Capsulimonadaceae bacterium]
MKVTILPAVALALALAAGAASADTTTSATTTHKAKTISGAARGAHTWALLVGISAYQSPMIASLHFPASDATAIAAALEDPTLGGVPASHVLLLTNEKATADNIKGSVDTFFKPNVKPGDQIIIFLAGHGVAKGVGTTAKSYLVPYDVHGLSTPALDASAVNLKDFAASLSALPASQFVAFVDACREDPTPGRGLKGNVMTDVVSRDMQIMPDENSKAQSVTFFACSLGQRAYEDPTYQHGVFSYWILDAIKQAAVPQKPDGAVDMGRLATYVTQKVTDWAKQQSAGGDFEVDQTPTMVCPPISSPVVLMHVQRPLTDETMSATPPVVLVSAVPDDASISVDGKPIGSGDVEDSLEGAGSVTITAQAPGYAPVQKTIQAYPGYGEEVTVNLPPASRGLGPDNDPQAVTAPDSYQKAVDADQRDEYEVAEAGYKDAIQEAPAFAPAYERLAELQRKQGRNGEYLCTLISMEAGVATTAHSLALLSYGYALYSMLGTGASPAPDSPPSAGDYGYPKSSADAADLALKAANAAVKEDSKASEAQRSLGFALVAEDGAAGTDRNKQKVKDAFGQAIFLDDTDPVSHYGLGFAIRFYAQKITDADAQKAELQRAVDELQQALKIRPEYYEAHRELAYCYHLMDDRPDAEKEYQMADANVGQATDGNEVAGTNCALAVLMKQDAQTATGDRKQELMDSSSGYWGDARETAPNGDLKQAMTILRGVGLSSHIKDFLPDSLKNIIDWQGNLQGNVQNQVNQQITNKIKFSMPHF